MEFLLGDTDIYGPVGGVATLASVTAAIDAAAAADQNAPANPAAVPVAAAAAAPAPARSVRRIRPTLVGPVGSGLNPGTSGARLPRVGRSLALRYID